MLMTMGGEATAEVEVSAVVGVGVAAEAGGNVAVAADVEVAATLGVAAGVAAGLSLADRVLDVAAEGATAPLLAASCACTGANESGKRVSAASKARDEERSRKTCDEHRFVGCVQNVKGVAGCIVG